MIVDVFYAVMQYIVIPVSGFAAYLYVRMQELLTRLTVLENRAEDRQRNHDKEIAEIKENTNKIFNKLDNIEGYLRK